MRILKDWKREDGVALVMVFVVMATLLLLTTALLQFSTSSMVNSVDNENKNKARANAEAGAAKLLKNWGTLTSVPETPFNGGTYSADSIVEDGRYYLVARGKSGSSVGVNDWQAVIKCRLFSGIDVGNWKYGMFAGSDIKFLDSRAKYQGSNESSLHSNTNISVVSNQNVTGSVDVTYAGALYGDISGVKVSPLTVPELMIKDTLVTDSSNLLDASSIDPGEYVSYSGSGSLTINGTLSLDGSEEGYAIIVADGDITVSGELNANKCPVILVSKNGDITIQNSFKGLAISQRGNINVIGTESGSALTYNGIMIAGGSITVDKNATIQYLQNNANVNLRTEMTSAFFTNPMIYSWDESYTKL